MNGYQTTVSDGFGGFTAEQSRNPTNGKGKEREYGGQQQQQRRYNQSNSYSNHQPQPQSHQSGVPSHPQTISPLDTLVKRGKQVASSSNPNQPLPSSSPDSTTNYQAAFALSRRTSLRSRTTGRGPGSARRGGAGGLEGQIEQEEELRHALDQDDDDARSLRSINLLGGEKEGSSSSRDNWNGNGYKDSSPRVGPAGSSKPGKSPQSGYEDYGGGPQRFKDPQTSPSLSYSNRESSNLLGGAFRDSIASDFSFNSITGSSERNSMAPNHLLSNSNSNQVSSSSNPTPYESSSPSSSLQRRESVDTVRSSEFGENGRWGKAWASTSDDEDSLWDGGSQMDGSEWDNGSNADRRSLMERDLDLDGEALSNSLKRTTLTANPTPASIYKSEMKQQHEQDEQRRQQAQTQTQSNHHQVQVSHPNSNPQVHPGVSRQHIVSLTPSIGNSSNARWSNASHQDPPDSSSYLSSPNPRPKDRDSVSTIRGMGGSSRDSVSTLRSGENGSNSDHQDPARVYVWPPSPAGSTASSIRSRNGDRLGSGLNPGYSSGSSSATSLSSSRQGGYSGMRIVEPQSAEIETASLYGSEASWDSQAEGEEGGYDTNSNAHSDHSESSGSSNSSAEFYDAADHQNQYQRQHSRPAGPVAPSTLMSQPLNTPVVGSGARRVNPSNFSDGRRDSSGSGRSGHPTGRAPPPAPGGGYGYSDPNQMMGMNTIGRTRAKAIADADGRESMVSDLDVETLRLEMSSRRDSTSTIGSRMSVGTVKWGEDEKEDQLRELNGGFNGRRSSESRYENKSWEVQDTPKVSSLSNRGSLQPHQYVNSNSTDSYNNSNNTSLLNRPQPNRQASGSTTSSGNSSFGSQSLAPSSSSAFLTSASALSAPTNKPAPTPQPTDTRTGPTQAEELLSQGIAYHEQGDLSRSAYYLERSARTQGGCVVGMCMWGMALREGWGVRKDQKRGAEWIQRAARKAGEMMGNESGQPKSEQELKAIKSELKLSVYELGKCYCYGWGVKMDKQLSLEYFELAGKLGDPDAAAEAGALWAAGKGCKKDLKKAAAFYRMAIEAGYDGVGLSWVYKPKWQ